jgi:Right handed beta helix region
MNTCLKLLLVVFGILFWMSAYSLAQAATYYVSPNGNNANLGTISQPFATLQKAHDVANPGDTIYMRGGTYTLTSYVNITKSGSAGNVINVLNYPAEIPILDGINLANESFPNIQLTGSYWYVKGLEIKNAPYSGVYITGSNNTIELSNVHHNVRVNAQGGGIQIASGGNNLILNNDVHHQSYRAGGTGGDGIEVAPQSPGNVLRGNRVWRNHDDGIDLWGSKGVLVENNWSWENGYDDSLVKTSGNGCGIKMGGSGDPNEGSHTIRNNVLWHNGEDGINDNGTTNPSTVYNNTAYDHGRSGMYNFNFWSAHANVLRNNLSFAGNGASINGSVSAQYNSWNNPPSVAVTSGDFVTTDFTANTGARQADGSLPVSNFLRLVAGSNLIDKGVNVGIAYTGNAPDLGAYEYVNSVVSLQAPSNLVVRP